MALNIKKLLVSQPKPASEKSPYFDIAEKYGVEIDFRPFIKVEPLSSKEFRQQRISVLDHTAVIFTSRHAIDFYGSYGYRSFLSFMRGIACGYPGNDEVFLYDRGDRCLSPEVYRL